MGISRRGALRLLAGGIAGASLPWPNAARAADPDAPLYLSACVDAGGGYRVSGFAAGGASLFDLPLPGRGHSFAVRRGGREAVHFARRPGRFALIVDLAGGAFVRTVDAPPDRHFYGHGVFGRDGRLLYASENDFEGERGVIGVYDASRG